MQASDISWGDEKLIQFDFVVTFTAAVLEAQDEEMPEIQFSPHFMLHGVPGRGKTLLGKFLFPPDVASMPPNDAGVVEQMDLCFGHKVLKIDGAGTAFFNNPALTSAIKFMYHNTWSTKTHGDRQGNDATMVVITTNLDNPIERLAGSETDKAFQCRFIQAEWEENSQTLGTGIHKEITSNLCQDIVLKLCEVTAWQLVKGKICT